MPPLMNCRDHAAQLCAIGLMQHCRWMLVGLGCACIRVQRKVCTHGRPVLPSNPRCARSVACRDAASRATSSHVVPRVAYLRCIIRLLSPPCISYMCAPLTTPCRAYVKFKNRIIDTVSVGVRGLPGGCCWWWSSRQRLRSRCQRLADGVKAR